MSKVLHTITTHRGKPGGDSHGTPISTLSNGKIPQDLSKDLVRFVINMGSVLQTCHAKDLRPQKQTHQEKLSLSKLLS